MARYEQTLSNNRNFFVSFMFAIYDFLRQNLGIIIGLAVLSTVVAFVNPVFLSYANLMNVLRQITTNLYLALAMTMVIIVGGIDLSVGSTLALTGVVTTTMFAIFGVPLVLALLIGILVGVLVGAFNGYFAATTPIPPFIITLATMNIARGLAYILTDGSPVRAMDPTFNFIGAGHIGVVPLPVIYLVIFIFICYLIMNKTKLGRHIYAVGGNVDAATFSGISVKKVKFFVFTFSGFMAGIAGVVLASRMFSGLPAAGLGQELDAIAAVVLGGTSMRGGIGKIGGTVVGALIIGVLNNGLNLMGVSSFWQTVIKGIVILIAVYADVLKREAAEKK